MKRYISLLMIMIASALILAGCGSKKPQETSEDVSVEETNPENGLPLSKQPDATAPVLASVMVVAPVEGKLSNVMDAVDELTEESLLEKLVELGTLGEGTTLVSFEVKETGETKPAGPGGGTLEVKNGELKLKDFKAGEGLKEDEAKKAVADTYLANFELSECEVIIE